MLKKVMTVIVLAAVFLFLAGMIFLRFTGDQNFVLRKSALPVSEGKEVKVSEIYSSIRHFRGNSRFYEFTPAETAEYEFAVSDIKCDEGVTLSMIIMDESFAEYSGVSEADAARDEEYDGTLRCRVDLQKNTTCYIGIISESSDNRNRYAWGCRLNVTKAPEDEKPQEIAEGQNVSMQLKADEKKSLLFAPKETGYYKFDAEIVSGSKSGYAGIDSITLDDDEGVAVTDGLSLLTAGNEYYVWVSAYDISAKAEAEVSCRMVGTASLDDSTEVQITDEAVIEYTADEAGTFAIYSVSDGDPDVCVYDADGFPLRNDSDSGAELSENEHDFAFVIDAAQGDVYRIFVSGKFEDCRVIRARYTGDGTSIGPDDIEKIESAPVEQTEETDAAAAEAGAEEENVQ